MAETGELVESEVGADGDWAAAKLRIASKARKLVQTGIWLFTVPLKMTLRLSLDKQKG
jgi:hypothetical protein